MAKKSSPSVANTIAAGAVLIIVAAFVFGMIVKKNQRMIENSANKNAPRMQAIETSDDLVAAENQLNMTDPDTLMTESEQLESESSGL